MGKFAILLCAASTAFATLVFVLPQSLRAGPVAAQGAAGTAGTLQVPAVVDLFQAEKTAAPRLALPAQF